MWGGDLRSYKPRLQSKSWTRHPRRVWTCTERLNIRVAAGFPRPLWALGFRLRKIHGLWLNSLHAVAATYSFDCRSHPRTTFGTFCHVLYLPRRNCLASCVDRHAFLTRTMRTNVQTWHKRWEVRTAKFMRGKRRSKRLRNKRTMLWNHCQNPRHQHQQTRDYHLMRDKCFGWRNPGKE